MIIRQTTKTTPTIRYLQIFILFVQGGLRLVIHGVINPYKWPTNEWGNWGYGAICCPWPCITYQEVVSEATVLAALEDEGRPKDPLPPRMKLGETGDPIGPNFRTAGILVMFFFVSWEVCMYDTFVMDLFFQKKSSRFFKVSVFLNTKLNIRKKHKQSTLSQFPVVFFNPDASTFDFESFRARFSKTLGRSLEGKIESST